MRPRFTCASIFFLAYVQLAAIGLPARALAEKPTSFQDPFSNSKHENRRALRGPWQFMDGVASCTQDNELYIKYADHGPVMWYDNHFRNAEIEFTMKPSKDLKTFAFTLNGKEGHAFRFITSAKESGIRAFSHEARADSFAIDRIAQGLKPGEWTKVAVKIVGSRATIRIGDYEKQVFHQNYDVPKVAIGIGFSFGTLEIKDFTFRTLD